MSAIAYFLERAGIATTGISLVRENTEALQPPRFLWVPFPLGRPLGAAGNPAFQHRVIERALALLEAKTGPVLANFAQDVPDSAVGSAVAACPVSFARQPDTSSWSGRLQAEMNLLAPWYDVSLKRRGRTTVGVAGMAPAELCEALGVVLDGDLPDDFARLKLILEDLKAWHQEAITAQPGELAWTEVRRLLWDETELGLAMRQLGARLRGTGNPAHAALVRVLVPRAAEAG